MTVVTKNQSGTFSHPKDLLSTVGQQHNPTYKKPRF